MNNKVYFLILILLTLSCNSENRFIVKIKKLYEKDVEIENVEVKTIFASENELQKLKNLLLMDALYIKKDSLLQLTVAYYEKNNEYAFNLQNDIAIQKLNHNRNLHQKFVEELNNEIQRLNNKGHNRARYFLGFYNKNREFDFVIIFNKSYDIIYAQDSALNSLN